jgi:Zn-dependent peptidase ImmA (M78 family)
MISTEIWRDPLVQRFIRKNGGKSPEFAIEKYVQECLAEARQDHLAIDVELIASVLGVKRRIAEYSFAGRIYADPSGQLVMDLNVGDSEPRRRFTCAHELIHTAFPGFKRETRYRLDQSTGINQPNRSEEESLCDLGASMMLMPAALVAGNYRLEANGMKAVEQLADDASVSLEAAGNRLVKLSDRPAAFLVLEEGHKPADRAALRRGESVEPKLRVRYAVLNNVNSFVPPYKSVDPDSVYGRAARGSQLVQELAALPGASGTQNRFLIHAGRYPRFDGDKQICRVLAVGLAAS